MALVYDTGIAISDPNYGNAVALDASTNTLYFVDSSNTLRYLDLSNPTSLGTVTYNSSPATTWSIDAQPATGYVDTALQFDNATFYAGAYWYIESESPTLRRAVLDATTRTITRIDTFTLVDGSGNPVSNATNFFKFGDIASDGQGNIYGWTVPTNGQSSFFKVDVTPTGTTPAEIATSGTNLTLSVISNNSFSMQLTYAGNVLYGHRTGLNEWYAVDTTTGALTAAVAPNGAFTPGLRDIAGPLSATPTPFDDGDTAKLGDYVWNDYNRNGIQDSTESGIAGVSVALFDSTGTKIKETTTDTDGRYLFDQLAAGEYSVGFEKPSGFSFTTPKQGSDSATDSDADPITGKTTTISLPADTSDLTWDAGLFRNYAATGLTPGYWKNHTGQWDGGLSATSTSYEGTMFSQWGTYGVTGLTKELVTGAIKWQEPSKGKTSPVLEDMSLAKALAFGGGDGGGTYNPYGALARHSSAALLNASEDDLFGPGSANPSKGYRFNPDRVRQLTSMALTSDAIVRGVISAPLSPVGITLTPYEVEGSGVAAGTYTGLNAVVNLHKVFAFNNQLGG